MNQYLNTLNLQLKAHTNLYAHNAIIQILVKILFFEKDPMDVNALKNNNLFKGAHISDKTWDDIIASFSSLQGISYRNGKYQLTTALRKKIEQIEQEAILRDQRILDKYFSQLFTEKKHLAYWLADMSFVFFKEFSEDWLADLVPNNNAVIKKENSIKDLVRNRTLACKELDARDKEKLTDRYFNFITDKDADVYKYLWDYGTSAFAAKLITAQNGVDAFTIDTFQNSEAILDTNILLFISLDASARHDSITRLTKIFESLNISASILPITKIEYQDKVDAERQTLLKNIELFTYGTALTAPNDDFTQSAIQSGCKELEDFERYFSQLHNIPEFGERTITVIDTSDANRFINESQHDEKLKQEVNSVYKSITGRDKRENPLLHDVGLLECVEKLKANKKMFILSEEVGVIQYANTRPLQQDLPLAIRLSTILNIFANTDAINNAEDYVPLFATLIQNSLMPSQAFTQENLQSLYFMDQDIARLPKERATSIAHEIHQKRMHGVGEKEITIFLSDAITKGRLDTTDELENVKRQVDRLQIENDDSRLKLENVRQTFWNDELRKYDDYTSKLQKRYYLYYPIITIVVSLIILWCVHHFFEACVSNTLNLILNIAANIIFNAMLICFNALPKIKERKENRDRVVSDIVMQRMNEL